MSIFAKAKKARENKKGFTLVELIVVLVILAILAAILVPGLTKWIDKANEKQIVIDARTAYLAAQTVVSEAYGAGQTTEGIHEFGGDELGVAAAQLSELTPVACSFEVTNNMVTTMSYTAEGRTATLAGGAWTVTTAE